MTRIAPARTETGNAPSWIQPRSFGLTFSCSSAAACLAARRARRSPPWSPRSAGWSPPWRPRRDRSSPPWRRRSGRPSPHAQRPPARGRPRRVCACRQSRSSGVSPLSRSSVGRSVTDRGGGEQKTWCRGGRSRKMRLPAQPCKLGFTPFAESLESCDPGVPRVTRSVWRAPFRTCYVRLDRNHRALPLQAAF